MSWRGMRRSMVENESNWSPPKKLREGERKRDTERDEGNKEREEGSEGKQNRERENGVCEATCENLNHIPGSIENILTVMETKRASHVVGQFSTEGTAADTV